MTDTERLRDLGLSDFEIEDMQADGFWSWSTYDVEAQLDIIERYLDAGLDEEAEMMLGVFSNSVDYWQTLVEDLVGKSIYFNEADERWHDSISHEYVKDPYFDTHSDQYELEQYIVNQYG